MQVSAYKSLKKNELYIFIEKEKELEDLPDEMLVIFGKLEHVIDFELTPEKKLAREDATTVIESIKTKGYFIQMPPEEIEKLSDIASPPERLDNIF